MIVTAKVSVVGTRPLLMHHFGEDAIPLERGERTGVAGNDPEEWRRSLLVLPTGQLYLDPPYVFGAMRGGARYTKKGRGSVQTAVAASLQVLDDVILLDRWLPEGLPPRDPTAPVYVDVRYVRNPASRAGNVRYRLALSSGWRTSFSLMWDSTIVSRTVMEAVAVDAGRFAGLADGRAIGFGRFAVEAFNVEGEGAQASAAN